MRKRVIGLGFRRRRKAAAEMGGGRVVCGGGKEEIEKVKNIEDDSQKMELVNWSRCYTRRNRRYYCRR